MSKFTEVNEKIAEGVTETYQKIEDSVVGGYKKIEDAVVGGFNKIADKFMDTFLTRDGESAAEQQTVAETSQEADGTADKNI